MRNSRSDFDGRERASWTQSLVQVLNNFFVFGMDVQEAVEAARFTHDGNRLFLESRIAGGTRRALERRRHEVDFLPAWSSSVGGCIVVAVDPRTGTRHGGADPRRDAYAVTT